ncbi:hypothetical protein D8S82_14380 [Mycobacterium hodleri]|uniref:PIN like domain-containing protein n=1 Tax=Mycolicibacterium hodleri TaxID=49897 RepID=A0A544W1A4_9MYCO|nr:PIN domain-containing protein [Mycolicibacterium hodleri]TQR85962.1 hypothetical protein D8S82_14380 [Mycolicibacterium hodleri]
MERKGGHVQHTFAEWYEPDDSTLRRMLRTGTIALDTNVLLDLYRTGSDQRTQILDVFEQSEIRPRVWIPYQVGLEYQRKRLEVAKQHQPQYEKVRSDVAKLASTLEAAISGIRDTEIQKSIKDVITEKLTAPTQEIINHLDILEQQHVIAYEQIRGDDPLRVRIDKILADANQVGPKPDATSLEDRIKLAESRYENKTPPGYLDDGKPDNPKGDALIWFEILDHAASSDRPLIFITSDIKADWYRREGGHTIGPRTELRSEFATRSKHLYHQVRLSTFLHLARTYLNATISGETIDSVVALDEERRIARERERDQMRLKRFRRTTTHRELSLALSLFETGSREYRYLQDGLDIIDGVREYDRLVVNRALMTLDRAAAEKRHGSNFMDPPATPMKYRHHIRELLHSIGSLDDEELAIINEVAQTMDPQKLIEFLEAYQKLRKHSDGFRLTFTEGGQLQIDHREEPIEDQNNG